LTAPEVSAAIDAPATRLTWSERIGKRVRDEPWPMQAVSTVRRIEEALEASQLEIAAQLVDYFMEEAKICHNVYQTWTDGFDRWIRARGVSEVDFNAERHRLAELLQFKAGAPFDPMLRWRELSAEAGTLAHGLRGGALTDQAARDGVERLRSGWQGLHDRWVDLQAGLMTFIARRFGEKAIGDCYREVLRDHLAQRYGPFDLRRQPYEETIERNLYFALEAMRGHLSGPGRRGDLSVTETEDSWVISFDPCGSGGRQGRGHGAEEFGFTTERHDWAWNEIGVCYYCAHCCMVNELWAVEQWGAPIRVTDSPLHPRETSGASPKPCTWTIYKSFDAIPETAYTRLGLSKPRRAGEPTSKS
jgi:hypothetical protein